MYNCIYVEDEALARKHVINSIAWDCQCFKLAFIAKNGLEALEYIKKNSVDIVITDIRMDFMDGLTLAKELQDNFPYIKVIIISGYSDFDYAKQAMSFGVTEYLVKPVRSLELLDALKKVSKIINDEREYRNLQHQNDIRTAADYKRRQQRFLIDLSMGLISLTNVNPFAQEVGLKLNRQYYYIVLLNLNSNKKSLTLEQLYLFESDNLLPEEMRNNEDIIFFSKSTATKFLIVMGDDQQKLSENVESITRNFLYYNKETLSDFNMLKIKACVSNICKGHGELISAFLELSMWDSLSYFNSIDCDSSEIINIKLLQTNVYDKINSPIITEQIMNLLRYGTSSQVESTIENIIEILIRKAIVPVRNPLDSLVSNIDFLCTIKTVVKEMHGDFDAFLKQYDLRRSLSVFSIPCNENELRQTIRRLLLAVIDYRDTLYNNKNYSIILEAKRYIDSHFHEQDITLSDVASRFNISANYFSTLFSKEVGQSFIEYITYKRIAYACELLISSNQSATEIAYKTGYNDSNYFSKAFKKIMSISPRAYRSMINSGKTEQQNMITPKNHTFT